jgi:hypothetical protein
LHISIDHSRGARRRELRRISSHPAQRLFSLAPRSKSAVADFDTSSYAEVG